MAKANLPLPPPNRRVGRTSWNVKLHKEQDIKIERTAKGMMLIARPLDVDALMKKVRKGKLTTVNHIRAKLASDHKVDFTCPLTTGIFIWAASEAAVESMHEGKTRVTPFWRTLKSDGSLNDKYPGGVEYQQARLEIEGHTIMPGKGKRPPKVKNFEKYLAKI